MRNGPYILVVAPKNYPGKRYRNRYCYEHTLVWWQRTGELLAKGDVIHHINGDKHDNSFSNLERMPNSKHVQLHAKKAPVVRLRCSFCKKLMQKLVRDVRSKRRRGQRRFYCGRSCHVKSQWANGTSGLIKKYALRN